MTSRVITLAGFAVITASALALEVAARRSSRLCTLAEALAVVLRHRPMRILLLGAWLWLGWHLFVRVEWL
jgi:hypothetical protein